MEELAHGEDWNRHPTGVAARRRYDERRHGHFGNVEFGKAQLPPEHLGGMHHGGNELDSLRRDTAFDQRPRALVVGERDAQLEAGFGHEGIIPQSSARAALILRSARRSQAATGMLT